MTNPKLLSHSDLIHSTKQLAAEERRITVQLIAHLEEIDQRNLHLELGYASLFEFVRKHLGYSESSAQRRIDAMRLSREVPEVREAVQDGRLTLSTVGQVQKFLRHERKENKKTYSPQEKRDLLNQMAGLSSRECERELASISPQFMETEKVRAISATQTQISFTADAELMRNLEQIKDLWAHQNPEMTYAQVIEKMAELTLRQIDPVRKTAQRKPKAQLSSISTDGTTAASAVTKPPASRHIPAQIRREVWQRDQGRCAYLHPESGRRCGSTYMLELDHIHSYAHGGSHDARNLRLLCRNHNVLHGVKTFGPEKMKAS